MDVQSLAELSDVDLLARAHELVCNERRATAALVAHLAEIESRKLYLGAACASMFVYCTRVLHLSEHAAYNRIEAARAARRFPAVLASLEAGRLHLTAIRLLAPILTDENHHDVLGQATHKSKREVEELLARLRPQPDVTAQIRRLPEPKPKSAVGPASAAGDVAPSFALDAAETAEPVAPAPPARSPERRAVVVPLAPERYKLQVTVGAATRDKLRRAQDLLRHRIPDGDVADVIDMALDLLVQDLEKKKFAAVRPPKPSAPKPSAPKPIAPKLGVAKPTASRMSRHIPADVKRQVWERDRGRCAFVSTAGDRCCERGGLEFDHAQPHADGGGATADNVRLLCRHHNQYEAQQFYGLWQADEAREPMPQRPMHHSTRSGTS